MQRRFIVKNTWLSAYSYAQSRFIGYLPLSWFLFPWFPSLIAESELGTLVVMYGEKVGGLCLLFIC
jgi:hypothetical protein